jgi:hypothetical protein
MLNARIRKVTRGAALPHVTIRTQPALPSRRAQQRAQIPALDGAAVRSCGMRACWLHALELNTERPFRQDTQRTRRRAGGNATHLCRNTTPHTTHHTPHTLVAIRHTNTTHLSRDARRLLCRTPPCPLRCQPQRRAGHEGLLVVVFRFLAVDFCIQIVLFGIQSPARCYRTCVRVRARQGELTHHHGNTARARTLGVEA